LTRRTTLNPDLHPLAAYRPLPLVRQGPRHRVSVAEAADGTRVVLKQLRAEQATGSARFRLRREHGLLLGIESRFVPRPIELLADAPEPTLVLPWHGGVPLAELPATSLTPAEILDIALQAALALQDVYRAGVLHLDLSSANLVWNAAERQLALIDFSSAMLMQGEEASASRADRDGTLPFMSPEQAGLLNRPVDNRSDLYSLGITLYRLAAGALPFSANDALGWAHAHLTARPEPLARQRPDLPPAFCAIVHRLIAKSPDERYQTPWGLAHDLARCREALANGLAADEFALGQRDVSDRLDTAPALHGRDAEQAILNAAWQRSARGPAELVFITGEAGLGKTALLRELRPAVLARAGSFLYGKFDASRHDVPYSALSVALGGWIDQRLAEPGPVRARWAKTLAAAFDDRAGPLFGLLPRLGALLGEPRVMATQQSADPLQLRRWVAALLGAICSAEQPLAWVIDDLQWADEASLALLQSLLAADLTPHLLLLVSYRPADPARAGLPAAQALERAAADGCIPTCTLRLTGLAETASAGLVRAILRAPADDETALALTLHAKARGNPFALATLLAHLRAAEVLRFDPLRLRWTWDAAALGELPPNEQLIDWLLRHPTRLPEATRRLLALGACLGREFDLAQITGLAALAWRPGEAGAPPLPAGTSAVQQALQPACEAQWLVQRLAEAAPSAASRGLVYRFVHDRMQETAHGLLDEAERRRIHDGIGHALLADAAEGGDGDALLAAVNHLNLGFDERQPGAAREALAALNLRATRHAAGRAAPAQALDYADAGLALAPTDGEVRRALRVEAHRLCYLVKRWEAMDRHHAALCAEPAPVLDMVPVHVRHMYRQVGTPDYEKVARDGLGLVAALGVALDLDTSPAHLQSLYAEYCEAWRAGAYRRLLDAASGPPPAADPKQAAAISALIVTGIFFHENPPMKLLLALQVLRLLLEQGLATVSSLMHDRSRQLHIGLGADYRAAHDEWPFWLEAITRHGSEMDAAQMLLAHATYVLPWNARLDEVVKACHVVRDICARHGNVWSYYQASCPARFESGEPLPRYDDEAERACAVTGRFRVPFVFGLMQLHRQVSRLLQGQTAARWSWNDDAGFSIDALLAAQAYEGAVHMLYWHFELELAVLSHRPARALHAIAAGLPLLVQIEGQLPYGMWVYYGAMAEAMQDAPDRAAIASNLRQLEQWAGSAPSTFAAKAALVRAELHRVEGRTLDAMAEYEAAIRLARQERCLQGHALAEERLSRMARALGWRAVADGALGRSRGAYAAWGAIAKLDALNDEFGPLPDAFEASPASGLDIGRAHSTGSGGGNLDIEAVLKAAQTITRELDYERLLQTLIETLLQYAGADRAVLLLAAGESLQVAADARADTTPAAASNGSTELAWSVLRYARQTGEILLLDDPERDDRFAADPHLQALRPQSLLCLPMRRQDSLLGFVYLENRATAHAFSRQRLRVLDLLVGHVVGALDNARLVRDLRDSHDQLESKVRLRTRELEQAREAAEAATRAKGDFLANMSHEIRTPMNAILGMTHLALKSGLNPRQHNYVQKTERAAHSLLGLINDILDFSKIEAGKLDMENVEFALADVLDELVDLVEPKAREKGLALGFDLKPGLPRALIGDPLRLRQVLVNLGNNAVKFTERGSVTVRVEPIASADNGTRSVTLDFSVQDTGVGMTEAQRQSLFQPFMQADSSITRRYGGTGLGLAISRQLVGLMQGEIGVESQPGRGSRFHFSARFGLPAAAARAPVVPPPPVPSLATHRGTRVLLVEDNDINQELAHELLSDAGLVVTIAQDGHEALQILASRDFDLVLMDCQMPVMDGYEATRLIRLEPRWRELPIIAMTANAMTGDKERMLAAGMDDYIAKPISVKDMFATLSRWIPPGELELPANLS